jgi:hypothetical protein
MAPDRVDFINGLGNQAPQQWEGHVVPVRHMYVFPSTTPVGAVPISTPAPAKIYMLARFGAQPGPTHPCAAYTVYLRSPKPDVGYVYYFFDQLSDLSPELITKLNGAGARIPYDTDLMNAGPNVIFPVTGDPWVRASASSSQGNCIGPGHSGAADANLDIILPMNLDPQTPNAANPKRTLDPSHRRPGGLSGGTDHRYGSECPERSESRP